MTNKEAKNKLVARIEEYFEDTGKVGFPNLDLSEFEDILNLQFLKLGGDMFNHWMVIKGDMENGWMEIEGCMYNNGMEIGENKIGISSVMADEVVEE